MSLATYTLMHKSTPTVRFTFDLDAHQVKRVLDVPNADHAPMTVFRRTGLVTERGLNRWWHERGLLASGHQLRALQSDPEIRSSLTLAEKTYCLSLSDCYWVNDDAHPQEWERINFFDNPFTQDLNLVAVRLEPPFTSFMMTHTPDGDSVEQRKKWMISNGERLLMKAGGSPFNQAAYNEVIATRLFERLLDEQDFVPYGLYKDEKGTYCASRCMLHENEELIPMYDLLRSKRKPPHVNRAAYTVNRIRTTGSLRAASTPRREVKLVVGRLRELGIHDPELYLTKMFTCDYILANADRHFYNFGAIRNADTLRYSRMTPIYDTGLCLWCQAKRLEEPKDFAYMTKPFRPNGMKPNDQLALFNRYDWFDEQALDGFAEEAKAILDRNPFMPKGRSEAVRQGIERNIAHVIKHVHACRKR